MNRRWLPYLSWGLLGLIGLGSALAVFLKITARDPQLTPIQVTGSILWALLPLGFGFVAALIIFNQPYNLIGWLLMLPALAYTLANPLESYLATLSGPPAEPSLIFTLLLWYDSWSWLLLIFPILLIALYFPTGKLLSPRWRWVAAAVLSLFFLTLTVITLQAEWGMSDGGFSIPNPLGSFPGALVNLFNTLGLITLPVVILLCIASIIRRYRHNGPVERQQIKWLLFAGCIFAVFYLPVFFFNISLDQWSFPDFSYLLFPIVFLAFPAAVAIAVLRYRLWDIDLIIRKTLVYGALTVLLALVYFGAVVLMQQLFGVLTGEEDSPVAIVISTLAIAALFNPLRHRLQGFIDRRFYRQRYNAEKILAQFAALSRNEVELSNLTGSISLAIQNTVAPAWMEIMLPIVETENKGGSES